MPLVRIIYQETADHPEVLRRLQVGLQEIVASALTTPNARLVKDDIELIFELGDSLNIGKDLKVIVSANDFAERKKNLQERSEQISAGVKKLLSHSPLHSGKQIHGFVYVRLSDGGLGKF